MGAPDTSFCVSAASLKLGRSRAHCRRLTMRQASFWCRACLGSQAGQSTRWRGVVRSKPIRTSAGRTGRIS